MPLPTRIARLLGGFVLVVAILLVSFSAALPWLHTYGASAEEIAAIYPGDDLIAAPVVDWTHALTINAPPEAVWPWIAQLGDVRGGFYSYTFIENLIARADMYHNANRILPEFQNPQPGDVLITDTLQVREVQPGSYLLADLVPEGMFETAVPGMGWVWLWHITPQADGGTRLVVRMMISTPPDMASSPLLTAAMDLGAWVMELNMLHGIQERAEGIFEPAWIEAVEIALWFAALITGLAAGWLFVTRRAWLAPLAVGVAAVLALLVFTLVQPAVGLRALVDLALLAAVLRTARVTRPAVQLTDLTAAPAG